MKKYLTPKKRSWINEQKRNAAKLPRNKAHRNKKRHDLVTSVITGISKQFTNSNVPECNCLGCKEKTFEFLEIDHINGRKKLGHEGWRTERLYNWIKRQLDQDTDLTDEIQVLCHSCNWGKGMFGICPHIKKQA